MNNIIEQNHDFKKVKLNREIAKVEAFLKEKETDLNCVPLYQVILQLNGADTLIEQKQIMELEKTL